MDDNDTQSDTQGDTQDVHKDGIEELTERQRIIYGMLEVDGTLSATAISEKISEKTSEKMIVTSRTIEHDLAIMKKMGVLRRVGGRKTGHWEVVNKE